jgi:ferrous iron transport protein A
MVLTDAKLQKPLRITSFIDEFGLEMRLRQLGLVPGDQLRVLRQAPLGGPLLVEINGRAIALGRRVACRVEVEEVECASH